MTSLYPSAAKIEEIFADRDTPDVFEKYLSDTVDLTVVGKEFALAGNYKGKAAFHDAVYGRMAKALKTDTISLQVTRVIGGGDSPWAAVESFGTASSKSEKPYHMEFVDLVRFNSKGQIAQIKEYFDNGHMHAHATEHKV